MKNKQYTEEDTFNALKQTKFERVQADINRALTNKFRLEQSELIAILKEHNWKISEYWAAAKAKM